jgi:DNA-binding CsgD family transcriptional regulator
LVFFDAACWHAVDPATAIITGCVAHDMFIVSPRAFAETEYGVDDVDRFAELAQRRARAASLSETTGRNLASSARARRILDHGYCLADELRIAFVAGGMLWGTAALFRAGDKSPFRTAEVELLSALSGTIGEGFRRATLISTRNARQVPPAESVGVVVLDGEGQLVSMSPSAERLISDLSGLTPRHAHESPIVQCVAARAQRLGDTRGSAIEPLARARVRTRSGRWLKFEGTVLSGVDHVAVTIHPAAAHEIAPLVMGAYGLSPREQRIARMCREGLSTAAIAATLRISEYTVQDHLKSIFQKTVTRSRAELVAKLFVEPG